MKTLIYTEDGKPTDETIALVKKLKGTVCYRSELSPQKEVADVVYSNSKAIAKLYDKVEEIKPVKGDK